MYNSAAFSRQRNILINAVSQIMIAYFDRKELCFGELKIPKIRGVPEIPQGGWV